MLLGMKSCLGMLLLFFAFACVAGSLAFTYGLNNELRFSPREDHSIYINTRRSYRESSDAWERKKSRSGEPASHRVELPSDSTASPSPLDTARAEPEPAQSAPAQPLDESRAPEEAPPAESPKAEPEGFELEPIDMNDYPPE